MCYTIKERAEKGSAIHTRLRRPHQLLQVGHKSILLAPESLDRYACTNDECQSLEALQMSCRVSVLAIQSIQEGSRRHSLDAQKGTSADAEGDCAHREEPANSDQIRGRRRQRCSSSLKVKCEFEGTDNFDEKQEETYCRWRTGERGAQRWSAEW